jgi:signal transduction histidine kinase
MLNLRFAFEAPNLRAVIEIAVPTCVLASAWMLRAHFRRGRRLSDLLILGGLLGLALMQLTFSAWPAVLGLHRVPLGASGPAMARLLAAGTLAAAALVPRGRLVRSWQDLLSSPATVAMAVALVAIGVLSVSGQPANARVWTVAAAVLMLMAGLAFMRTAVRERDRIISLLGWALITFATAWIYPLRMPDVAGSVSGSELLRMVASTLLLAAGLRARARMHQLAADQAVARERRRLVNDLHDGLAQDLAFIAAHGNRLARDLGGEHPIAVAARRALAASRGAIVDLAAADAPTAEAALRAVADEAGHRSGANIVVRADSTELTSHEREELVRIAREAIANAVQHGRAEAVTVSLRTRGTELVLSVKDNGIGMAAGITAHSHRGFGLSSMRDRANGLGGRLSVHSSEGGGTELEVVVP